MKNFLVDLSNKKSLLNSELSVPKEYIKEICNELKVDEPDYDKIAAIELL